MCLHRALKGTFIDYAYGLPVTVPFIRAAMPAGRLRARLRGLSDPLRFSRLSPPSGPRRGGHL